MENALSDRRCALPERLTDIYIITMLLIFPLFPGFSGYRSITVSKYVFFLAATGVWCIGLLTAAISQHQTFPKPAAPAVAALVYLGVCVLSWLCSPDRAASFLGAGRYDGLLTTACCVVIFLFVSAWARPKLLYARAFGLFTTLCAVIALLQLAGLNPLRLFPGETGYFDSGRAYTGAFLGTLGNTNLYDAALCLALPLFFALYVCGQGREFLVPLLLSLPVVCKAGGNGCYLALLLCALAALPLLMTELSRVRRAVRCVGYGLLVSAAAGFWQPGRDCGLRFVFSPSAVWLFAAGAAVAVLSFFRLPDQFCPRSGHLRRWFALLAGLLALLALVWVFLSTADSGTVYELHQLLTGHPEDSFGSSRIRIWRDCLALIPEHPLLGGGPGTLALRLDIVFSRLVPETGQVLETFVDNAHNVYLSTLTDTGILGLAALLSALTLAAVSAMKRTVCPLISGFALGAMCCAIHEFFGLGLCIVSPMFWIFLGLLCSPFPHSFSETEVDS